METSLFGFHGAWIIKSPIHEDQRGYFREIYKKTQTGIAEIDNFVAKQCNFSSSGKNVLRGIHYSLAEEGQAKWITCTSGEILDVIVDLRENSETFGRWNARKLEADSGESIFISSGFGHGFLSMKENTTVTYLLSTTYSPEDEMSINPFDPTISIEWPCVTPILSRKDMIAPSLLERMNSGELL